MPKVDFFPTGGMGSNVKKDSDYEDLHLFLVYVFLHNYQKEGY